jgi:hypothetical protein
MVLNLSAARTCRYFKPLFAQHVHAGRSRDFFKEFKLCAPDGSRSLIKRSVMHCHRYSGQQRHMIDKRPEKREEKLVDHMSTSLGIIFTVPIKYQNSTENGQFPTVGNIIIVYVYP